MPITLPLFWYHPT